MITTDVIIFAFLGGIVPVFFWLNFWLKEDKHHEPRGKILGTFFAGMLAVFPAIILQQITRGSNAEYNFETFLIWAFIEEMVKFGAAYYVALRSRFADEPIDQVVYIVTAALGFAALENSFFLLEPLSEGNIIGSIATSQLRFIGASLLHVLSSGIVGLFLAYSFFKSKFVQRINLGVGMIIATLLHAAFNTFIITFQSHIILVFSMVWIGIIVVILILEKIKRLKNIHLT